MIFKKIVMILVISICSINLVACKSDEDKKEEQQKTASEQARKGEFVPSTGQEW